MAVSIDWSINTKQQQFLNEVMLATRGKSDARIMAYGGAIRGGKTFCIAGILLLLCRMFPRSKWVVIRTDFTTLEATTIPTFEKMIGNSPNYRWSRNKGNYHLTNLATGAKIFFYGENIDRDPKLDAYLGLECNGFFLEQGEELSEAMFEMAMQRSGSHYISPMPPAFVFLTFNPTQKWPKRVFYEPETLPDGFYYLNAKPTDNPLVTADQWDNWNRMDERLRRQFVEGDWSNFDLDGNRWAYAFDELKHVTNEMQTPRGEVFLSFDFNRNPMSCIVFTTDRVQKLHVYESIKIPNSNVYEICDYILAQYPDSIFQVTGDASGNSGSAMVKDNLTYYKIIREKLNLGRYQLHVPTANPSIEKNRAHVNGSLSRADIKLFAPKCKPLIFDLNNATVRPDGTLVKGDRNKIEQQLDLLDCFRYACNIFLPKFAIV
jgi:hypothetical protein